ncbi:MAG: hypothetical protein U5L45_02590 [Saprospiraceae bacterium]|nr:hypothetical protein [Saprospiraceae bacterium]
MQKTLLGYAHPSLISWGTKVNQILIYAMPQIGHIVTFKIKGSIRVSSCCQKFVRIYTFIEK